MTFFFNDTATTEIYTLSLHDALPIYVGEVRPVELLPVLARVLDVLERDEGLLREPERLRDGSVALRDRLEDRKSTRLNSSHANISYAVFCLKKKNYRASRPTPGALST